MSYQTGGIRPHSQVSSPNRYSGGLSTMQFQNIKSTGGITLKAGLKR